MMTIRQFYLAKLAEECAEVAQRALKQMQFGPDEVQKNQDDTNAARLREEFNHLVATGQFLIELGELPTVSPEELLDAVALKRFRIEKYLKYSQELGMVEKEDHINTAKEEMKKALLIILELLNNPSFCSTIVGEGYRFNADAIFKAFTDAAGWKMNSNFVEKSDGK